MVHRILLVVMICVLATGLLAPAQAASGDLRCGDMFAQAGASAGGCGHEGMPAADCAASCAVGACIPSHTSHSEALVYSDVRRSTTRPLNRCGTVPEADPPKRPFL